MGGQCMEMISWCLTYFSCLWPIGLLYSLSIVLWIIRAQSGQIVHTSGSVRQTFVVMCITWTFRCMQRRFAYSLKPHRVNHFTGEEFGLMSQHRFSLSSLPLIWVVMFLPERNIWIIPAFLHCIILVSMLCDELTPMRCAHLGSPNVHCSW